MMFGAGCSLAAPARRASTRGPSDARVETVMRSMAARQAEVDKKAEVDFIALYLVADDDLRSRCRALVLRAIQKKEQERLKAEGRGGGYRRQVRTLGDLPLYRSVPS